MTLYRFADPSYLWLLAAVPPLVWWYWRQRGKSATVRYSSLTRLRAVPRTAVARFRHLPFLLRVVGFACLIVALARPQSGVAKERVTTEGIDILMAIDLSSSMLAEDLKPNRVEAAKKVAAEFVHGRRNDRIGLVVFSGDAFTQCPLTLDYGVLEQLMSEMRVGMIEDGTAIGMGLATAVKRLRSSQAKSRVIILLTDGRNNQGEIDPVTAAQMAQAFGIRIYAIGAGSRGEAPYPVDDPFLGRRYARIRVDIDEDTLKKCADLTGGRYFRATDAKSLENIYQEIDQLEKTEVEVEHFTRYGELFIYPLALGLALVLCEVGLAHSVFRRLP